METILVLPSTIIYQKITKIVKSIKIVNITMKMFTGSVLKIK